MAGCRSRFCLPWSCSPRDRLGSSPPTCSTARRRARPRVRSHGARLLSLARSRGHLREQDWRAYAAAVLPLNPQGFGGAARPRLQHRDQLRHQHQLAVLRAARRRSSLLSQMVGLTVHNFLSAAAGIAVAAALARAFARQPRRDARQFLGRSDPHHALYVLLPLSIVVALAFVALGVPQTLPAHVDATTLEGAEADHRARARPPARRPSSSSAPTAAASSTPTPPTRSRTRTPGPTSSRSGRS